MPRTQRRRPMCLRMGRLAGSRANNCLGRGARPSSSLSDRAEGAGRRPGHGGDVRGDRRCHPLRPPVPSSIGFWPTASIGGNTVVRRGPITEQGSTLVRLPAVKAAHTRTRIAERRGASGSTDRTPSTTRSRSRAGECLAELVQSGLCQARAGSTSHKGHGVRNVCQMAGRARAAGGRPR